MKETDTNDFLNPSGRPEPRRYKVIQAAESWERAKRLRKERIFVIDGWVQTGKLGVLSGVPKLGKSTLTFETVCSVTTGTEWLELVPVNRMPVLMMAYENEDDYWWDNFQPMLERREELTDNFREYWFALEPESRWEHDGHFNADIAVETIRTIQKETGQKHGLLIIDTARAAFNGIFDDVDNWEVIPKCVREVCNEVKRVCRETGWAGLLIHHDTKSGGYGSGSAEWKGAVDYGIHYEKGHVLSWNGAGRTPASPGYSSAAGR